MFSLVFRVEFDIWKFVEQTFMFKKLLNKKEKIEHTTETRFQSILKPKRFNDCCFFYSHSHIHFMVEPFFLLFYIIIHTMVFCLKCALKKSRWHGLYNEATIKWEMKQKTTTQFACNKINFAHTCLWCREWKLNRKLEQCMEHRFEKVFTIGRIFICGKWIYPVGDGKYFKRGWCCQCSWSNT